MNGDIFLSVASLILHAVEIFIDLFLSSGKNLSKQSHEIHGHCLCSRQESLSLTCGAMNLVPVVSLPTSTATLQLAVGLLNTAACKSR